MSNKLTELLNQMPRYKKRMYDRHQRVVAAVTNVMVSQGLKQKDLAERMEVDTASLSRTLSPKGANLTLETIGKIEDAIGEDILTTKEEVIDQLVHDWKQLSRIYA